MQHHTQRKSAYAQRLKNYGFGVWLKKTTDEDRVEINPLTPKKVLLEKT